MGARRVRRSVNCLAALAGTLAAVAGVLVAIQVLGASPAGAVPGLQ